MSEDNAHLRYVVILCRANGRLVKESTPRSKYSAKQLRRQWEEKYDETYFVKVSEQQWSEE